MGWNEVNLADVSPTFELIPATKPGETLTFEVLGAKYKQWPDSPFIDLSVQVAITGGESSGRQMFLDYPDPDKPKCDWSKGALKRLEVAVGVECAPGEDKVEWLNKLKGYHFAAPMVIREYKNKNDETVRANSVPLFKVTAAA